MARRKGWSELSDAYKKRLQRNGITATAYRQGASLQRSRGHAATPEHGTVKLTTSGLTSAARSYSALAVRAGITEIIPHFDTLTRAEQNRLGKLWLDSFFTPGKGTVLTPAERTLRGLHPKDKRVYRHASDAQINGRIEFQQWVDENRSSWNTEDWVKFKTAYAVFSQAA